MHDARVLVVDDSAAMRALFCDILDQARHVSVVGVASSAAEARDKIRDLRPNVLTLDVEMPGMSGMDFLAEIMAEKPMPVVMLSSVTQMGTGTAQKAIELGAIECFPKPLHTSPEDFNATVGRLGKIVLDAANIDMDERLAAMAAAAAPASDFVWNGTFVALAGSTGAVDALKQILPAYPANCPPTLVCLPGDAAQARAFVETMASTAACRVKVAEDGDLLEQGTAFIACDPERHVVVEPGNPPKVRLLARDPVAGVRPSADLMLGSLARTRIPALAVALSGQGQDGAKGFAMLREAGGVVLAQDPAGALAPETPGAALAAGAESLGLAGLPARILQDTGL